MIRYKIITMCILASLNILFAGGGGGGGGGNNGTAIAQSWTRLCIPQYTMQNSNTGSYGIDAKYKTIYYNCIIGNQLFFLMDRQGNQYKFKPNITSLSGSYPFFICPVGKHFHQSDGLDVFNENECKQSKYGGPTTPGIIQPPPKPPVTTVTDLIVEEINTLSNAPHNLIYTKTSASEINIRIYHKTSTGSIGSGLNSASCTVSKDGKQVASSAASYSIWSGGGAYVWKHSNAIPTTGSYTIQCTGKAKDGSTASSPKMSFAVVPASYTMKAQIRAVSKNYTIDGGSKISDGKTTKLSLSGADFPIIKTNNDIIINLSGKANNRNSQVDTGANSSIVTKNYENKVIGHNASAGAKICVMDPPTPSNSSVSINRGNFNGESGKIVFKDVYEGTINVQYTDDKITRIVDAEKVAGRCSGSGTRNGECPYPPIFEYSFKYLVVPHNFSLDITSQTGTAIKVLYYGQGNIADREDPSNLKVVAEDNNNAQLKNYISGCAAKDIDLELGAISGDVSISFIDPTNTGTTTNITNIKASDFTANSQANLSRILSVKKKNGSPFHPNEVAEPSFLNAGFNKLIYFTGMKGNTNYPQYNPRLLSSNDMVILRGRINSIDTDNAQDYTKMPITKVNYEFYCKVCNLDTVNAVTGASKYAPSPTLPGWWIDNTFSNFNTSSIKAANIETSNGIKVGSVSAISNGVQNINYASADAGKYQVKIKQNATTNAFPSFLFYNPYYDATISNWGTSSFVTIYSKIKDETRDFGIDTGNSKNTRSGGRTGGF